jgi:hypothetical protein
LRNAVEAIKHNFSKVPPKPLTAPSSARIGRRIAAADGGLSLAIPTLEKP